MRRSRPVDYDAIAHLYDAQRYHLCLLTFRGEKAKR